jgi:hypothetical protein
MLRVACQRTATASWSRESSGRVTPPLSTEIIGAIVDPSHLHGLLDRITGLGLTVHSLTQLDSDDAQVDAPPHTQPAGVSYDPGANSKGPT